MFPRSPNIRPGPVLLLPTFPPQIRFFPPPSLAGIYPQQQFSINTNASASLVLPKSFPIPIEGREDFFCVDPTSLSNEQLDEYKREMVRLIEIEKNNLERISADSNGRINAYNQGISLARETLRNNSMHPQGTPQSSFLPNFRPDDDGPIGCVDPKTLSVTQLHLYIKGIEEEINYEKKLTAEMKKESTSRTDAYQNGIQRADYELTVRQGKTHV